MSPARGVYLLSFLPEFDVNRIVDYSAGIGKRSFAALLPDNAYGNVVEAAFKQAAARKGGRIVAFEKYRATDRCRRRADGGAMLASADALFIADDGDSVVATADALAAAGANCATSSCSAPACGTIRGCSRARRCKAALCGARSVRFGSFAGRYRTNSAASRCAPRRWPMTRSRWSPLVATQGAQRFAPETLTNPSGFAGIDGLFRFRSDGTNERGLAVMKVAQGGSTPVAGSPKSFGAFSTLMVRRFSAVEPLPRAAA